MTTSVATRDGGRASIDDTTLEQFDTTIRGVERHATRTKRRARGLTILGLPHMRSARCASSHSMLAQ